MLKHAFMNHETRVSDNQLILNSVLTVSCFFFKSLPYGIASGDKPLSMDYPKQD